MASLFTEPDSGSFPTMVLITSASFTYEPTVVSEMCTHTLGKWTCSFSHLLQPAWSRSSFIASLLTVTNLGLTLTWPQFIYFNSLPWKWAVKFRGWRWSDPSVRVKVCVICEQKPIALIGAGDPQCHLSSAPLLLPPCPCYARRLRRYICLLNTCTNLPAAMEPCKEARWEDGNAAVSPVLRKVNLIYSCN